MRRPTPSRTAPVVPVLAALLALAGRARAEDAPDPATWLRQARAAEAADRDPEAAVALYRRIVAAAPDGDAARDAGLRLLELLEARGDRAGALEAAQALTARHAARLDDEGKRRVHEAMARLLPAGSHARSPLGDVYVVPGPTAAAASPLDAKVRALLPRVGADPSAAEAVLADVAVIGADALPALERILREERLDLATFAARGLARMGTAGAIDALGRALRAGDGFARSAAVRGLYDVRARGSAAPLDAAAVERLRALLDDPALADAAEPLRQAFASGAPDAELLERARRPGAAGAGFLVEAVRRGLEGAVAALDVHLPRGAAADADLVARLAREAGADPTGLVPGGGGRPKPRNPRVPMTLRRELLARLVTVPGADPVAVARVAAGCTADEDAPRADVGRVAWPWALGLEDAGARRAAVLDLVRLDVALPEAVADDDVALTRLVVAWCRGPSSDADRSPTAGPFGVPAVVSRAPFLRALAAVARDDARAATAVGRSTPWWRLERVLRVAKPDRPPADVVEAWLGVLDALEAPTDADVGVATFALSVAAPTAPRRVVDRVAAWIETAPDTPVLDAAVAVVEARVAGPEKAELAVAIRRRPQISPALEAFARAHLGDAASLRRLAALLGTDPAGGLHVAASLGLDVAGPADLGPAWVAALRGANPALADHSGWYSVARLAAAAAPDEVAGLARTRLTPDAVARPVRLDHALLLAVAAAGGGAARLDLLRAVAACPVVESELARAAVGGLWRPDGDRALVVAKADDPQGPLAVAALTALFEAGDRAALARVAAAAVRTRPRGEFAELLVLAARDLRLVEALPWLRLEARERLGDTAPPVIQAIDTIRVHHARLAALDAELARVDPRAEVEPLLDDPDPELRAAAVAAYGALAGKDGLPRLLRLAKAEQDATVRRSVLDTVERIAKAATPPAAPAKAPDAPPAPTAEPSPQASPDEAPPK